MLIMLMSFISVDFEDCVHYELNTLSPINFNFNQ